MTVSHPILTNIDGARTIARLIDDAGASSFGTLSDGGAVGGHAVVVQLVTAIAAGSTVTVKADIMRLNGDAWEKTGQQLDVRSLTGLAVSTTGRRIARRISRWGWGVVET